MGKGTIEIFPLPGKKLNVSDLGEYYHWIKLDQAPPFHIECKDVKCPICEMLKPKTRWQKFKIRISKLWKHLNPFTQTP